MTVSLNALKNILGKSSVLSLCNVLLRLGSLGFKLLLTIFIARYLSLGEMGTYGLITSVLAIAIQLLGMRLDYRVVREIVDANPLTIATLIRDEIVFYCLNYGVLILAGIGAVFLFPGMMDYKIILVTVVLSVLESLCTVTSTNFIYLKRPILANLLFFVRSAAWVIPLVGLGFFFPVFHSLGAVFILWFIGILFSLLITAYMLRHLPWKQAIQTKVNWTRIFDDVKLCLPIWVGAVGAVGAANIDRFIVEYSMTREMVGVLGFFSSFAAAVSALVSSGINTFKLPDLISTHRSGDTQNFRIIAKKIVVQSTIVAIGLSIILGFCVPVLATFLKKPEISEHNFVFWLLLVGVICRVGSEGLNNVFFARHQDGAIWKGSIATLVVSFLTNIWLIPQYGLVGAGYSSILSGLFIIGWRWYFVRAYDKAHGGINASGNG